MADSTLQTAETAPAIFEAAARFAWFEAHSNKAIPADCIPTPADLVAWLPECPLPARTEADALLRFTLAGDRLRSLAGDRLKGMFKPGATCSDGSVFDGLNAKAVLDLSTLILTPTGWTWQVPEVDHDGAAVPLDRRGLVAVGTGRVPVLAPVPLVHQIWLSLSETERRRHPAGPLVWAWLNRTRPVAADRHHQGILPLSFKNTFLFKPDERLPDGLSEALTGPQEPAQGLLPFPDRKNNGLVPVLPLRLYDMATRRRKEPGRGAPFSRRRQPHPRTRPPAEPEHSDQVKPLTAAGRTSMATPRPSMPCPPESPRTPTPAHGQHYRPTQRRAYRPVHL